ncbi:hypothetical protein I317_02786 [Kwoniella heveanensis CBS 569]|nr:hypothetical protein I317_02786 [Kwoniella heveanensis CBS 569]
MPATLYLRPSPRAYFLLTETHALIFRQPDARESKASKSVVVAEFLPIEEVDMGGLVRASRGRSVEGVLGVTSVPSDRSPIPEIFLLLVSHSTLLPPLLPGSSLRPSKVLGVEFHSLTSSFWDTPELLSAAQSSQYSSTFDPVDYDDLIPSGPSTSSSSSTLSQAQQAGLENPCNGMRKYLESGGFFYAEDCKWDISSRMGDANWVLAEKGSIQHPLETFDERFVWNASLLSPFLAFRKGLSEDAKAELDQQALLIPVIQGFCGSLPISTGAWSSNGKPETASLGLISRLSWKRAGARFRTRGIDDDGEVANFVETELVFATDNAVMSYVQVRGSVPLFWQQPSAGLGTLQQKVEITRPPQATQPAFDKHFLGLIEHYHSVHAVNLLGQKDAEAMLSQAYSDHLASLRRTLERTPIQQPNSIDEPSRGKLDLTPYDFHAAVKTGGHEMVKYDFSMRLGKVADSMEEFGWTAIDANTGGVIERQGGVFRTNCLDCLDRTNYVQDVISSLTLSRFLASIGSPLQSSQTLWAAHRELWADNGDRLSKIYAGTGALNTSATRSGKKTFAGLLSDATKSVGRAYINNFQDKGKQNAIDMLLGMMAGQRPVILFDPISDSVHAALSARVNEYSRTRTISIFSGTWNLNGKAPDEALDPWLFPPSEADIYMIAFQEIVDLNATQILQTDPAKKRIWEKFIMDTFAMRKGGKTDYLLFRSEQLVGSALIIIVKSDLSKHIRGKTPSYLQTGLSGLSGNKGGVGIRFQLFDSNVCFVTSHLTAGHSNVAERNADWKTLTNGMRFLRGKMLEDHEIIIWSADLNYRIALTNPEVRGMIEAGDLDSLLAADQLLNAVDAGETFVGYDEGPIRFDPTYKYDNGTDDYDTSEKQRIPAWTDRVLFKGSALRLKEYNRAELYTSDHRPVYAVFDATIREVDHARKDAISKEIMHSILASSGDLKFDQKVENSLGVNSGVGDLVKGITRTSVSPALRPPDRSPRLPPRPSSAASMKETSTSIPVTTTANGRMHSLSVSNGATASSSLRALANSASYSSLQNGRRPAPPVPSRPNLSPALSPNMQTSPIIPLSPDNRALSVPSPLPRSARSLTVNSTGSSSASSSVQQPNSLSTVSPAMSPASTGDFVMVPSSASLSSTSGRQAPPPRLPPRTSTSGSGPTPKSSADEISTSIKPTTTSAFKVSINPPSSPQRTMSSTSIHKSPVKANRKPVPSYTAEPVTMKSGPVQEANGGEEARPSLASLRSKFEQPAASQSQPRSLPQPIALSQTGRSGKQNAVNGPSLPRSGSGTVVLPRPPVPQEISTSSAGPRAGIFNAPRKSMDINGSPPSGLMSPVRPDNVQPKIPPKPRRLSSAAIASTTTTATPKGAGVQGSGSGSSTGDGASGDAGEEAVVKPSAVSSNSSPENAGERKMPPSVPKKPVGLKGVNA